MVLIAVFIVPLAVFLIPQFIRKKKWLALYSFLSGTLILYAYYDLISDMSKEGYNDSMGDGLGMALLYIIFISFLAGVITRLVALYVEYKYSSRKLRLITTIAGFAFIPLIIYIPALL